MSSNGSVGALTKSWFFICGNYSWYQEGKFLKKITSSEVIDFLDEIFSRLLFTKSITTNIGRQFVSEKFKNFCSDKNIKILKSPPYWSQANGEVENTNSSLVKRLPIEQITSKKSKNFCWCTMSTPIEQLGRPQQNWFSIGILDKLASMHDVGENILDAVVRDLDMLNKKKREEREQTKIAKQEIATYIEGRRQGITSEYGFSK